MRPWWDQRDIAEFYNQYTITKHRSLIKNRVRDKFNTPNSKLFLYISKPFLWPKYSIRNCTELNIVFFPYSYSSSCQQTIITTTVNISFTALLFGANVPYRWVTKSHAMLLQGASFFSASQWPGGGTHWTHSNIRSLTGNPRKRPKLCRTKSNVKTTNDHKKW